MKNQTRILLVEDNPGDARLIEEVIKENKVKCEMHLVSDGEAAIEYLKKAGNHINEQTPDLIILDLNLPKKDGFEVLDFIKTDDSLKFIPVVILTVSQSSDDILKSYNKRANCFITKPSDFGDLIKVIEKLKHFWMKSVELPKSVYY